MIGNSWKEITENETALFRIVTCGKLRRHRIKLDLAASKSAFLGRSPALFPLALLLFLLVGCNNQPRVSSPESLELIKQAYTACNTKNTQRLDATQKRFKELVASKTLTDDEQESFQEIFDLAQGGDWQKAQDRAFSFAESQLR